MAFSRRGGSVEGWSPAADPYCQGVIAWHAGMPLSACPYRGVAGHDWWRGWVAAGYAALLASPMVKG